MTGSLASVDKPKPGLSHRLGTLLAVVCGLVLVRSAQFHLGNPFGFLVTVYSYEILPKWGGVVVAAVLPPLQLVLGLLLVLFPRQRKCCLQLSVTLFLTFAVVQLMTLQRGLNISCGCFGPSIDENPIGPESIGLATGCGLLAAVANRMIAHE